MNTFHPYHDEDEQNDRSFDDEDDMLGDYGMPENDRFQDRSIGEDMLPPDDSLNEMDLLVDSHKPRQSPGYANRPKSRGRYETPPETAHFNEPRKQWKPRGSNFMVTDSSGPSDQHNLNEKDRQFPRSTENYQEIEDQYRYPDVSQINEEDLMESSTNQEMNYRPPQDQYEESYSSEDENADIMDFHKNFLDQLSKMGVNLENSRKVKELDSMLRNFCNMSKDPTNGSMMQQEFMVKVNNLMQEIFQEAETQSMPPQKPSESIQFYKDDQNLHPNLNKNSRLEESKLEHSILQESGTNHHRQFQPKNEPYTPESVERRQNEPRREIELSERAKKFDNVQGRSPIYPTNAYPEVEDEEDEMKQMEIELSMSQRLAHKTWQIRRNAYVQVAEMFEGYCNGQQYFLQGPNDEEIEYNPLDKYQEWLIRMIRDSNLTAQYEGLNTLNVYLQHASDINVKNATMSSLPDLLDKIGHSKNSKNITPLIIELMFEKGMGGHIVPELLRRFKTARNKKITEF